MPKKDETPQAIAYIRTRLDLDKTTGTLIWKIRSGHSRHVKTWNTRFAGQVAGHKDKTHGFVIVSISGVHHLAHRIVFALENGRWPADEIDHIDGNPTNNRPSNLREASRTQNIHNRRHHKDSKSGIKGVTFRAERDKWRACIYHGGKQRFLGHFDSAEEAAAAYAEAAITHHGAFAKYTGVNK
jgi:hypothetical protein